MTIYQKLIRDKDVDKLTSKGIACTSHVAEDAEYEQKLFQKLSEEARELTEARNTGEINEVIEEIVDMLEVLHAIADFYRLDWNTVEESRVEKREMRGGFEEQIILEETEER